MFFKNVKFKGLLAAFSAAVMCFSGIPVFAAGTGYSTVIGGTKTTSFDKYLVMDQQAQVPNASFTFSITAGTSMNYNVDGKTFEVLSGVDAEDVVITGTEENTISYAVGDETLQDENDLIKDYDYTTEKYAKKTATVDFSACVFQEPGIYRYILTETGENQGVENDDDLTRIIDVYVFDDSSSTEKRLSIAGYVLHSNENDSPVISMGDNAGSAGAYTGVKSQGFTNEYNTEDLTIRKEVSGNQASRDKYFEFTVEISKAVAGTKYDVDLTGADLVSGSNAATIADNASKNNPAQLTVGDDGTVSEKFYLQHGQQIVIQGLAIGTAYEVSENPEDYKSTPAGVADYDDPVDGTITNTSVQTSYLNTREGIIPTGIIMQISPFIFVTVIGGLGIFAMIVTKKRDK